MAQRQDFILSASLLKLNSCLPIWNPGSAGADPSRNTVFRKPESRNSCCEGLWHGKAHSSPGWEARRAQIPGERQPGVGLGLLFCCQSELALSLRLSSDSVLVEIYRTAGKAWCPCDQLMHGAHILRGMASLPLWGVSETLVTCPKVQSGRQLGNSCFMM